MSRLRRPALLFHYAPQAYPALADAGASVDALIVPASLAAAAPAGVARRLRALGRPFLVDPRTPIFQFAPDGGTDQYARLASVYGEPFAAVLAGQRRIEQLSRHDWRQAADRVTSLATALGTSASSAPLLVLAPYLAVDPNLASAWSTALQLLDHVVERSPDVPVAAVVLLTSTPPSQPDFEALAAMLRAVGRRVGTAFLWMDECGEQLLGPQEVRAFAKMIEAHRDLELYSFGGGYLSLLLHHFGLAGVASGVGYGEQRRARDLGSGGGPVKVGYYLPLVHALVAAEVAERVIAVMGEKAACSCLACRTRPTALSSDRLMLHYLLAKDAERARVREHTLDDLITELWTAYGLASRCAERLPENILDGFPHHHLENWARGLVAAGAP